MHTTYIFMSYRVIIFCTAVMCIACGALKHTDKQDTEEITEHVILDSLIITPQTHDDRKAQSPVRFSSTRSWDLIHTSLQLSFDWKVQAIHATAALTITPFAYSSDTLSLNAQFFEVQTIKVNDQIISSYSYDQNVLDIFLPHSIEPGQIITCEITYIAHPHRAASSETQGFFFIDPFDTIPHLPTQIWTIGETQYNSQWFPTIDYPNERHTQDIRITVDTQFVTLSNGALSGSVTHANGTRTDHWTMTQSHAPYLTVLVVGRYDIVSETWNGIPVNYYVDKGYGPSAKDIFAHTPEMLTFFSDLLQYPYPWPKYDQVVVHDFTAGAMENTTAVTFATDVQKHGREFSVIGENDGIVAHEMFHHWFGDLLTCEDWSHLALNEGFANYGEYLWKEHKYGMDDAQQTYLRELQGYLFASQYGIRPLVENRYENPDVLFDAHSYNKGCLVLHHLRRVLGDDVFFRGIRKYLHDNAFRAVETQDLRLAMEDVSGRDLTAFFEQWYFSAGHPVVSITENYNPDLSRLEINLSQTQDADRSPEVFQFPLDVQCFFADGTSMMVSLSLSERNQLFFIPVMTNPVAIMYDPYGTLPWKFDDPERSPEQCRVLMSHTNTWLTRRDAILSMVGNIAAFTLDEVRYVLQDPHWAIRQYVLSAMSFTSELEDDFVRIAKSDSDLRVRLVAYEKLGETGDPRFIPLFEDLLNNENKVETIRTGLVQLSHCDLTKALAYAKRFEPDTSSIVISGIASVYALHGDYLHHTFFERGADVIDGQYAELFFTHYATWISGLDIIHIPDEVSSLRNLALSSRKDYYTRYYATYAVWLLRGKLSEEGELIGLLDQTLRDIIFYTTDPVLVNWYQNFN